MNGRKFTFFTTLLLLAALVVPAAFAQSLNTGAITGTVTDPSGAVIPNAQVTAKNLGTGAPSTTTTNANGFFRFPLLGPGMYQVSVNQSGFQAVTQNVTVAVGQTSTTN